MKYLLLIPLVLAFSTGCSSTGGGGSSAPKLEWPKSNGTIKISNTVVITSNRDYGMKTVDGSALSGDGGQAENQEPPFEIRKGSLKNAIAKSWPESIHVRGDSITIENVYIPDVGEDAISTPTSGRYKKLTIRNCQFAKAADKIIQLNEADGVLIENCKFEGYKSAIRLKEGVKNVTIRNCTFQNGQRAVVLDKGVSKPKIESCKYYNTTPLYQG